MKEKSRQKGRLNCYALFLVLLCSFFFLHQVNLIAGEQKEEKISNKEVEATKEEVIKEEVEEEDIPPSEEEIEEEKQEEKKKVRSKEKEKKRKKKAKKESPKKNGKKVYLTFDDGPSENTDEVLKILDQYGVKGTFFVIGRADKESKKRYKAIVEKGHTIALHSYTHNYKQIYKNLSAFKKDFKRISDLVYDATGVRSKYYRFPGGTSNSVSPTDMNVFVNYFNKKGIRYYDWNVQCGDAVSIPPAPKVLYQNVINGIKKGGFSTSIVLIHDSRAMKNSVKALPMILKKLLKDGYDILPIDDDTVEIHHKARKR